jgi:AraC-like DNA-binding protein
VSNACLRTLRPPMQFQTGDLDRLFAGSGECLQLTGGVFTCRGSRVNLPAVRITRLDLNCGVQIRSAVEPWRLLVLLLTPATGCRILANAVKCTRNNCILISGDELTVNILGAASILWFDIDRRAFEQADRAGGFAPMKCVLPLSALERVRFGAYAMDRFAEERAGRLPPYADDDGTLDGDLKWCARALTQRARTHVESNADANRQKLVRAAQELMWEGIEEPPSLREICHAVKCSVRTLIYAFNDTFGMSPMKYFKVQRLNAAHRKLQSAESGARIFDVAADCGFWHLGHFGVDYKALFGTTPKMTSHSKTHRPY